MINKMTGMQAVPGEKKAKTQSVPSENSIQDSNPCFLGWHKRADLGQNSNQSNLYGEVRVKFWLDLNTNNLTDLIFDNTAWPVLLIY